MYVCKYVYLRTLLILLTCLYLFSSVCLMWKIFKKTQFSDWTELPSQPKCLFYWQKHVLWFIPKKQFSDNFPSFQGVLLVGLGGSNTITSEFDVYLPQGMYAFITIWPFCENIILYIFLYITYLSMHIKSEQKRISK